MPTEFAMNHVQCVHACRGEGRCFRISLSAICECVLYVTVESVSRCKKSAPADRDATLQSREARHRDLRHLSGSQNTKAHSCVLLHRITATNDTCMFRCLCKVAHFARAATNRDTPPDYNLCQRARKYTSVPVRLQ